MKATLAILVCVFLPLIPQIISAWLLNEQEKEYEQERNVALFDLISQGAILSDGQLYLQINGIIQQ